MAGTFVDSSVLAWISILAFTTGVVASWYDDRAARYAYAGAWVVFAAFWLNLVEHFIVTQGSFIEGALVLFAVPASLYTAYLLYNGKGSLTVLSRAVAVMGLIYLPFETIPWLSAMLIEAVTVQTEFLLGLIGQPPVVEQGTAAVGFQEVSVRNVIYYDSFAISGAVFETYVVLACTGIGSMSIFAGLVAAVNAPLTRKLKALAVVVPVIWALNVGRVAFIALAHGKQWFRVDPVWLLHTVQENAVSWFIADRILAQSLAVVALVVITYAVVRIVPELVVIIEDVAFLVTGKHYDFEDALGVHPPMQPDGGSQDD